jgi:hypothetical protein
MVRPGENASHLFTPSSPPSLHTGMFIFIFFIFSYRQRFSLKEVAKEIF